ncbi:macro domain-containing protein [Halarsenatibacter silvermanii]|uniref:O-acetyl-ADP-ribose deacetylase (Regulator of RNase III), contains Macro domain n=1 Tax=Halarsenatibacter silvermanii TaxID=321763 RepID=A0A1G9H385_9FIRM|nr:macro domain-containing protein [Halarsenatibacter silvermanii]SDL07305.1 O-acetyl-ADP-ribose deacetylase (regulator of RNase III), contains Macro domain [Halarsenatibacter silvermanii]
MKEAERGEARLRLEQGDISRQQDVEAVVNAANARLETGGGVAGAIHSAAGPELAEEASQYAPIEPGEAVITGAHKLPNDFVIHCLGPVYGRDKPEDELLARCYRESLRLAEENEIERLAFPAISTGAFGYPKRAAAEIALQTVLEEMPELDVVRLIKFVLYSESDLELFADVLENAVREGEK